MNKKLEQLIEKTKQIEITPEMLKAQAVSWARGMTARCEHGKLDFEQCTKCRSK